MEEATAAASSAGTGLSALQTSPGLSILQGGATAASVLSSMTAARSARQEGDISAGLHTMAAGWDASEADLNANQAYLSGQSKAIQLQQGLAATIGGQRVGWAASGLNSAGGSAAALAGEAARKADQNQSLNAANTSIAANAALLDGLHAQVKEQLAGISAGAKGASSSAASELDALRSGMTFGASLFKRY